MSLLLKPNEQVLQECPVRCKGLLGALQLTTKRLVFVPDDWTHPQIEHSISSILSAKARSGHLLLKFYDAQPAQYDAAGPSDEPAVVRVADRLSQLMRLQYKRAESSKSKLEKQLAESNSALASYWRSSQRYRGDSSDHAPASHSRTSRHHPTESSSRNSNLNSNGSGGGRHAASHHKRTASTGSQASSSTLDEDADSLSIASSSSNSRSLRSHSPSRAGAKRANSTTSSASQLASLLTSSKKSTSLNPVLGEQGSDDSADNTDDEDSHSDGYDHDSASRHPHGQQQRTFDGRKYHDHGSFDYDDMADRRGGGGGGGGGDGGGGGFYRSSSSSSSSSKAHAAAVGAMSGGAGRVPRRPLHPSSPHAYRYHDDGSGGEDEHNRSNSSNTNTNASHSRLRMARDESSDMAFDDSARAMLGRDVSASFRSATYSSDGSTVADEERGANAMEEVLDEMSSMEIPGPQSEEALSTGIPLAARVVVRGRAGVLRYCGMVHFEAGEWAGIELDEGIGSHDGIVSGVRYFRCPENHGVFVPAAKVGGVGKEKGMGERMGEGE